MRKMVYKSFCHSDKLPQMMSLESTLVGAEDYKFANEKKSDVGSVEVKIKTVNKCILSVSC